MKILLFEKKKIVVMTNNYFEGKERSFIENLQKPEPKVDLF